MSARAFLELERTLQTDQDIPCPKCFGPMVTKLDAIGRTYQRCPSCQGLAKPEHRIPGEVLVPQTLIRSNRQRALPPIREGQLRCQQCARGVEGFARFCADCARQRQAMLLTRPCKRCGTAVPRRRGRPANDCPSCRA